MLTLQAFLMAILGGTFALGPAVYNAFEYFDLLTTLDAKRKRVLVAVVCTLLGLVAWGLAVVLGYQPVPSAPNAWGEAIWQYGVLTGFSAFLSATLIHGQQNLPPQG